MDAWPNCILATTTAVPTTVTTVAVATGKTYAILIAVLTRKKTADVTSGNNYATTEAVPTTATKVAVTSGNICTT